VDVVLTGAAEKEDGETQLNLSPLYSLPPSPRPPLQIAPPRKIILPPSSNCKLHGNRVWAFLPGGTILTHIAASKTAITCVSGPSDSIIADIGNAALSASITASVSMATYTSADQCLTYLLAESPLPGMSLRYP
jgi:hypothetical protein